MINRQLVDIWTTTDHRYDPWGSAIGLMFDICETLTHRDDSIGEWDVPGEWEFRHSSICDGTHVAEEYIYFTELTELLDDEKVTHDDIIHFGNVLQRYCQIAEANGRSY